jgi:hypothetical protein
MRRLAADGGIDPDARSLVRRDTSVDVRGRVHECGAREIDQAHARKTIADGA